MNLDLATFEYTNHRGEKSQRRVRPIRLWHGSTAWHSEPQWLLEAFDLDKMETRDFAMEFVAGWRVLMPSAGQSETQSSSTPMVRENLRS